MESEIRKYPVKHPLLKKYIRFFWEIHIENARLNHKLIPQRNINLRINLNDTPHFICSNGKEKLLEDIYFPGLQDHFKNDHLKINGKADVLGICFEPEGFYPFFQIPVSEFKNQILGAREIGFKLANNISEKIKNAADIDTRLDIIENELVVILINSNQTPDSFRQIFNALRQTNNSFQISEFCRQNNLNLRKLERMHNKYVGIPAITYGTLDRFHKSLNQLLFAGFSRLSDLAYDNGYFDQMHFIKEFKRFSGNTPKNFIKQNNSILQIGKLS